MKNNECDPASKASRDRERLRSVNRVVRCSLAMIVCAVLAACGGGDSHGDSAASITAVAGVAGKVTYDFVPVAVSKAADGNLAARLDYANTQKLPVRHMLIEAVSADGTTVLGKTMTDDNGAYSINLPAGTHTYVRVTAQASDGDGATPQYLVYVRDNTAPEFVTSPGKAPLYSMRGSVVTVSGNGTEVDLNAASGWTGGGYGAPRTAAPFAILDQIVTAAKRMHAAVADVALPPLNVFWSVNNRPADGDVSKGFISTSHYDPDSGRTGLYILGAENVDTDEYDAGPIVHEFGHYVEANLSRSDSIGGSHSEGDALDMRVAFGEAWGNAFSSMMRDTPIYADTVGLRQQQSGVVMALDQPVASQNSTWFNESALGYVLYELYKSPDVGFAKIYQTMLTGEKTTSALTSIFSFAAALRPNLSTAGKATLDQLLSGISVQAGARLDDWGAATTSGSGILPTYAPAVFPVYVNLTSGATASACTTTAAGAINKIGNFRYLHLVVPTAGTYRINLTATSHSNTSDYLLDVYQKGVELPVSGSGGTWQFSAAEPGDYVATVARSADIGTTPDDGITDESEDGAPPAPDPVPHCFDVSMQTANP
jgi:hypothetical protein